MRERIFVPDHVSPGLFISAREVHVGRNGGGQKWEPSTLVLQRSSTSTYSIHLPDHSFHWTTTPRRAKKQGDMPGRRQGSRASGEPVRHWYVGRPDRRGWESGLSTSRNAHKRSNGRGQRLNNRER